MSAPTSPQLEDGYTRIANELLEALAAVRIPGEARQLLDVILRKTYGFRKKEDRIALSTFSEMTGLAKPHVVRGINKLAELNLVFVTKNGNGRETSYRVNKEFSTWQPLPKKVTLEEGAVAKNGNETLPKKVTIVAKNGNETLPKKGPSKERKEITKEIKEKTTTAVAAVTVRELSLLYNRYAGANVIPGGQIVILQDFIRDFTRETILEAFAAAASANIPTRSFLSWCKTRMERRQIQAEQQTQEQQEQQQAADRIDEIVIGSTWRAVKSGNLWRVVYAQGAIVDIENVDTGEESNLEKRCLADPEKFERVDE